jgi:outer membrane protein assembly factor BamB
LTATGQASGRTTTAPIDVTNVWSQSGYGPTHTGYEPNDTVLEDSIAATRNGYLSLAWLYESGAPVRASPAIAAGYAYVANTAGTVSAIDIVSGAPVWTYTLASGAAIRTTPAVGNADVVFGAQDERLYRVAKATGTLVGSERLDGIPTSPALANGTIFVATTHGIVYAIDAATGTQDWATAVGQSIDYSPAVDLATGVVVVGDAAGNVTTLDANSGAIDFSDPTGAARITASPVIVNGKVIVAASDGVLRAYDERSGASVWNYRSGGSPIGALATSTNNAYFGTDSGNYVVVSLASGQLVFAAKRGHSIVGLGHATDVTVDETASGTVTFSKDNEFGSPAFQYQTSAGLITQPAIVDGAVFVGAGDGGLYAFTNHGQSPVDALEHRLRVQAMEATPVPPRWPASPKRAVVRRR